MEIAHTRAELAVLLAADRIAVADLVRKNVVDSQSPLVGSAVEDIRRMVAAVGNRPQEDFGVEDIRWMVAGLDKHLDLLFQLEGEIARVLRVELLGSQVAGGQVLRRSLLGNRLQLVDCTGQRLEESGYMVELELVDLVTGQGGMFDTEVVAHIELGGFGDLGHSDCMAERVEIHSSAAEEASQIRIAVAHIRPR